MLCFERPASSVVFVVVSEWCHCSAGVADATGVLAAAVAGRRLDQGEEEETELLFGRGGGPAALRVLT